MLISHYQIKFFKWIQKFILNGSSGFTIIETIMAISVLAAVLGSIISLQASVNSVTISAANQTKANWALRNAFSEAEYLIETKGQSFFPENSSFLWSADKEYILNVNRTDLSELKPSEFVKSALNIYFQTNPMGDSSKDLDQMMGIISSFIDSPSEALKNQTINSKAASMQGNNKSTENVPLDDSKPANISGFCNLEINVQWKNGQNLKTWSNYLFLMDQKMISKIKIPNIGGESKPNAQGNSQN